MIFFLFHFWVLGFFLVIFVLDFWVFGLVFLGLDFFYSNFGLFFHYWVLGFFLFFFWFLGFWVFFRYFCSSVTTTQFIFIMQEFDNFYYVSYSIFKHSTQEKKNTPKLAIMLSQI